MADKPITGQTQWGGATSGSTSDLDANFTRVNTVVNSWNTYANYVADTGAANAYVVTCPANITATLAAGLRVQFKATNANTGASTLNVNATGVKNILNIDGSNLLAGQIPANGIVDVLFDGTQYQLQTNAPIYATGAASLTQDVAINGKLVLSVSANALTIALKCFDGNDPSSTNPVSIAFRNVTVSDGSITTATITAANSLVISFGSTMGTRNGIPFRLWFVLFNDGGTYRLGAINCLTTVAGAGAGSDVTAIYPLYAWGIASSTAEGGAGNADNAQTFYTGAAVTSKAFTVLGYANWESGLATAGTWSSGPTRVQLFGTGIPLPGQVVQVARTDTGAVATGTTPIPGDDTIPQNTEGDQYISQAITATSAANVFAVESRVNAASNSGAPDLIGAALFQDTTANALKAACAIYSTASGLVQVNLAHAQLALSTSSVTFKVRAGSSSAGTTTFNGSATVRRYGGVMNSYIQASEIMG